MKPDEGTPFTPAPGVTGRRYGHGYYDLSGTAEALIASRLILPDWLAELPKRVVRFDHGAGSGTSERQRGGVFRIRIWERSSPQIPHAWQYDGGTVTSWDACAWQPPASTEKVTPDRMIDLLRKAAADPFTGFRVKATLQRWVELRDNPIAKFGKEALAYIDYLEKRNATARGRS